MIVALGLGSSLGDRVAHLEVALRRLDAMPDVSIARVSRFYRTPPMRGGTARGWFLNAVAVAQTTLDAGSLLDRCRALESSAGRRRARYWGDRPLDLDILLFGDQVIETDSLSVPHPGIAERPFVYRPLLEVWPDAVDPRSDQLWRNIVALDTPRPVPVGVLAWPRRRFTTSAALRPQRPGIGE